MAPDPPQEPLQEPPPDAADTATDPAAEPAAVLAAEPEPEPELEPPPPPSVAAEPVSRMKEWSVAIALMIVFGFMAFEFVEFLRHAGD